MCLSIRAPHLQKPSMLVPLTMQVTSRGKMPISSRNLFGAKNVLREKCWELIKINQKFKCFTLYFGSWMYVEILFISCIAGEDRQERTSFHYNSFVIKWYSCWLFLFSHIFSWGLFVLCILVYLLTYWRTFFFSPWDLNSYPASSGIP